VSFTYLHNRARRFSTPLRLIVGSGCSQWR